MTSSFVTHLSLRKTPEGLALQHLVLLPVPLASPLGRRVVSHLSALTAHINAGVLRETEQGNRKGNHNQSQYQQKIVTTVGSWCIALQVNC